MKIKEILGEDGEVTLKPLPGAQQIVAPDGSVAGTAKDPAAAQAIKAMADKGQLSLGGGDDQQTSEDSESDPAAQQYQQQLTIMMQQATQPWEKVQLQKRLEAVKSGNVPHDAKGNPIPVLSPQEWEAKTDPKIIARIVGKEGMSPEYLKTHGMLDRALDYMGLEEEPDEDLISQGNHDVGGDPTDDFIDSVRDKGFEKAARHHNGTMSPLSEDDILLQKMLTIAGLK
jgi:hypothetical protein